MRTMIPQHPVMGGGAVAAQGPGANLPGGRARPTFTAAELAQRVDVLALRLGTKVTASALMLACVIVILLGAQSLLGTMQGMDRDIKLMNEQLAIANVGMGVLNTTMDALPSTSASLKGVVGTVQATSAEVSTSSKSIGKLATNTEGLNTKIGSIATNTGNMRSSLEGAATGAHGLTETIDLLNTKLPALVTTQHSMYLQTKRMRGGLDAMNASLAYVVRTLNFMTAPPSGQGMQVRADLPKETLPPIPGLRAETDPVPLFPRLAWPIYTGP